MYGFSLQHTQVDLCQGGTTNSAVRQKLGKLCNDFRESDCLEVIPSLQAVMTNNLLSYVYRENVDLLRLSHSSERVTYYHDTPSI